MNNTTLAIIQPDELDVIQRTAKLLAASGYFGTSQDGIVGMAQVAAKILAGRELGFGPFAAVNGIHLIQGKPAVGANLMAAAVRAHPRYDYRVKELSEAVCELEFFDNGKLAGISRFTIQEAATAELSTGKNAATWKKFPRNMLFARAMSNGVRWFAPDIFSGNAVYVPEELDVRVDGDGNVIETTYNVTQPSIMAEDATIAQETPQGASVQATNGYAEPRYAHLIDKLTGDCLERANRARKIHAQSKGPASPDQYRFLAGTIDDIVRHDGGHKAVLEVFVGRAVNGDNPPGTQLAGKLLDALLEFRTVEVDGEKVKEPNPEYKPDAVACVHSIWHLVRAEDGQTTLFEQEPQAVAA